MKKYIKRLYFWGLIVFIVVAFSMFIQHYNNNRLIEENVKDMTSLSVDLLNEKINNWLENKSQVIDDLENIIALDNYNDQEKLKILEEFLKNNDKFFSIYFGTPKNKMLNASGWKPPEDFDLRDRPWYTKAVKNDELIYTEAFINASHDDIIITIAKPVYSNKNGEFMGVIAGDLSIKTIISFVKNEKVSDEGFFMLIDSKNNILAHQEHEYSLKKGPPKLTEKYDKSIFFNNNLIDDVKKLTLNDKKGFLTYESVKNTDWYLSNFIPLEEYTDIFHRLLRSFFVALLISSIVFMIFFYIHNKYVISPLKKFDKDIRKIDLGSNLDYRIDTREKNDFSFLSQSINNVLDKTQDYFEELKEKRKSINYLANHDPLTGLPNRRNFMDELEKELMKDNRGAVMLLDLDNFKDINDTLGHVYGDSVLKEIAERLKKITNKNIFTSRFGGDEFLILIKNANDYEDINKYIKRIKDVFATPFIIHDNEQHINFSMGISLYPYDSTNMNQLVTNADTAMYRVKNRSKGNYMYFNQTMIKKLQEKKKIKEILRKALKNDEFVLNYQPQVNLKSGKGDKFEALLRLKNYDISPGKFIPIAEETGLIIEIGRWVTKKAIKQLQDWSKKGYKEKSVAINFSAEQLKDDKYIDFLNKFLKKNKVNPERFEIEITENSLLEHKEESLQYLDKLKKIGVKIALDDFGTGYSSFSQLTYIPADYIKLDKTLIERFISGRKKETINSLISLIHSLNLKVVAEGIEEYDIFRFLKENNCDYIQGYLFSKPLNLIDLNKVYDKNFVADIREK